MNSERGSQPEPSITPPSALEFVLRTVVIAGTLILCLEVFLSNLVIQRTLGPGSVGSWNLQLDAKALSLEQYQRQHPELNCILIGASDVLADIDPTLINNTLNEYHCYNFGIGGLRSYEAQAILNALLTQYDDIDYIIVGITPAFLLSDEGSSDLLPTAWVGQYAANPSVAGWLSHHSRIYQYMQVVLQAFIQPDYATRRHEFYQTLEAGQTPRTNELSYPVTTDQDEIQRLDRLMERLEDERSEGSYPNTTFLRYLGSLQEDGIEITLVETPIFEDVIQETPSITNAYTIFDEIIPGYAASYELDYVELPAESLFTISMWDDMSHLNRQGSQAYTEWLIPQLAED